MAGDKLVHINHMKAKGLVSSHEYAFVLFIFYITHFLLIASQENSFYTDETFSF